MPEWPEMRALAERIDAACGGRALLRADAMQFSALKTVAPDPGALRGRSLDEATSRGKYFLLRFGGPRILVHLSQGGRVAFEEPPKSSRPKGAVVRLVFEDAPALLVREYGTERKAGWWVLAGGDDGPLARLGPEPFDDAFAAWLGTAADRRRIHTILRDQRTVAGIGRGYADDICHRARLSPFASLASLDAGRRGRLLAAVREVLAEGLAAERRRTGGLPAALGDHWVVHGRHGEGCPACGAPIARVSYESHDVAYCPACQTGGRVLADRRLSRLLK